MKLTNENGKSQTWNTTHNGEDIIIRLNTGGDIVIIKNDNGEHSLLRRESYTAQNWAMIKRFYDGSLDSDYDKTTDANYLNPEAALLLEHWDGCDIELIDPETAFMSKGETFSIYTPKKGNAKQIFRNKAWPLQERTRWIFEDYEGGYLLHLHSEMDINSFMESVDGPALHVYKPTPRKTA